MTDHMTENPPAFPNTGNGTWNIQPTEGMSLRDWFAGQAAAALLTTGKWEASILADHAYCTADALLAQREKER